jgi:citrate lyase beta subunit
MKKKATRVSNAPVEAPRQPVHTVYGGAHLFKADAAPKLGALALRALEEYAPDPRDFAEVIGLPVPDSADPIAYAATIHARVTDKLRREAVEDFRIDFEDGYGNRPDEEEDGHARQAAEEVARGLADRTLPPFIGIRIKPLSLELAKRSLRTLEIFVTALLEGTKGALPSHFVVTLPKIKRTSEVATLVRALAALERKTRLAAGSLQLELMVETTESIFDARGVVALPALVAAASGRCRGAHFGTYDYTAACDITAAHQTMTHPACDFAKHVMQVALAGTGVMLSDGATNIMPVGPHKARPGAELSADQRRGNVAVVHRAWRIHYEHARHSLRQAFYQGWDLHPAQLPTRYAAVYSFFLEGLPAASTRLRNFMEKAAQATLVGDVFDDAATGQGLLNYFLRGLSCGAITPEEAAKTGLTLEELQTRSFLEILKGRRGRA